MAAPFDMLELAERLGGGDFTREQARTAATALSEALSNDVAVKADVEAARLQLEAKISEAKADVMKWVAGTIGFQTIILAAMKLFGK